MKYKVENDKVVYTHRGHFRNRGRKLGSRLSAIVNASGSNLSDIARIYCANRIYHTISRMDATNCVVARSNLSHVLANRDNSPAYVRAIESAWRLPIATIREYHRLDKLTPLTPPERTVFAGNYAREFYPERFAERQNAIRNLFGVTV